MTCEFLEKSASLILLAYFCVYRWILTHKNRTGLRFPPKFGIASRNRLENRIARKYLEKFASLIRRAYFWCFTMIFGPPK